MCDQTQLCWLGYTDTVTSVAELDRLASGHAHHALLRDAGLGHQPYALVAADQRGGGVGHDPLGAVEVIEVRVPDHDPIAHVDVVGTLAWLRSGGVVGAVDVRVEEDRQPAGPQAERRAAVPVECRGHVAVLGAGPSVAAPANAWA